MGQPVLLLAIYGFVFRKVFKVGFPELGEHSFVAFVACALWPWMAFQEGVQRATHAIVGNAGLVLSGVGNGMSALKSPLSSAMMPLQTAAVPV